MKHKRCAALLAPVVIPVGWTVLAAESAESRVAPWKGRPVERLLPGGTWAPLPTDCTYQPLFPEFLRVRLGREPKRIK